MSFCMCEINFHLSFTHVQVVASERNPLEYFLCEEKVPLLKERSEVKRFAQYRPLAPEEEVVRLVSCWDAEDGYVGRICLKTREEVQTETEQHPVLHSSALFWISHTNAFR